VNNKKHRMLKYIFDCDIKITKQNIITEVNCFYNVACKVTKSQPRNLHMSLARSIILWTHVDAKNSVKSITIKGLEKLKFDKLLKMLYKDWFLVSVRLSSYGCLLEVAERERSESPIRQLLFETLLSSLKTFLVRSQLNGCTPTMDQFLIFGRGFKHSSEERVDLVGLFQLIFAKGLKS